MWNGWGLTSHRKTGNPDTSLLHNSAAQNCGTAPLRQRDPGQPHIPQNRTHLRISPCGHHTDRSALQIPVTSPTRPSIQPSIPESSLAAVVSPTNHSSTVARSGPCVVQGGCCARDRVRGQTPDDRGNRETPEHRLMLGYLHTGPRCSRIGCAR